MSRRSVTNLGHGKDSGPQAEGSAGGDGSSEPWALARRETEAGGAEATRSVPGDTAAGLAATPTGARGRARHATARTAAGVRWSRFAVASWRVRWRLVAMVVVPAVTAAFLGGITIDRDASGWLAAGRVQNLAQLNVSVVRLAQALEIGRAHV